MKSILRINPAGLATAAPALLDHVDTGVPSGLFSRLNTMIGLIA
jgi:hypothetical protein